MSLLIRRFVGPDRWAGLWGAVPASLQTNFELLYGISLASLAPKCAVRILAFWQLTSLNLCAIKFLAAGEDPLLSTEKIEDAGNKQKKYPYYEGNNSRVIARNIVTKQSHKEVRSWEFIVQSKKGLNKFLRTPNTELRTLYATLPLVTRHDNVK